jgi:hypothetical protein
MEENQDELADKKKVINRLEVDVHDINSRRTY